MSMKWKKNIGNILHMTIDEALEFFNLFPKICKKLNMLISIGLGYLKLKQEVATLSLGEWQRLTLAKELSKRSSNRSLYLLDEPTKGLHFEDIEKLLQILQQIADKKNTIVIIEHNLDLIASSDYIIDLGPYSGNKGGKIVCSGTVKEICRHKTSLTAKYLKNYY